MEDTGSTKPILTEDQISIISKGIEIKELRMRDATSGEIYLDEKNWSAGDNKSQIYQ